MLGDGCYPEWWVHRVGSDTCDYSDSTTCQSRSIATFMPTVARVRTHPIIVIAANKIHVGAFAWTPSAAEYSTRRKSTVLPDAEELAQKVYVPQR